LCDAPRVAISVVPHGQTALALTGAALVRPA
jgi:hypothetical protein